MESQCPSCVNAANFTTPPLPGDYDRCVKLGSNAKIDLLKRVPLFAGCSRQELDALAGIADEIDLREGSTLTREGTPGREFFVLIEGRVSVLQQGEQIAELGPGDWFGEIALMTDLPRTAAVTAASPVRVLVITDRAFRHVVEDMPSIARKVLEGVGQRLARDTQ